MLNSFKNFSNNSNFLQKSLLIMFTLLPFALIFSIFVSDLFAALISLLTMIIIIKEKKVFSFFDNLKLVTILMILFYTIIIISLLNSHDLNSSFLPSFFYFRFFLMSFGIFYIIQHHKFSLYAILCSLLFVFIILVFDSLVQYNFGQNIFGYKLQSYCDYSNCQKFITSFFESEKKLGSYLIRIIPFIISLIIYLNLAVFKKYLLKEIIILSTIIMILFSSERTALIMFSIFFLFYVKILKHKFKISGIIIIIFFTIITFNDAIHHKLINGTLAQLEIIENHRSYKDQELKFSNIRYYSNEHQNLALTAISIFKENPLTGAGIKTFSHICNKVNYKSSVCSTHPHSIYPQILSEIGIFGFLIIVSIFFIILGLNLKMKFSLTDDDNLKKSFYVLNIGIIINIMPFIPSGSFFNNWISLVCFLPLGFWIYLFLETKKRNILFS